MSTPTTVSDKTNITVAPATTTETATVAATTSETTSETKTTMYKPITVRIQYTINNPREGLVFVEPDQDTAPYVNNSILFLFLYFFCFTLTKERKRRWNCRVKGCIGYYDEYGFLNTDGRC